MKVPKLINIEIPRLVAQGGWVGGGGAYLYKRKYSYHVKRCLYNILLKGLGGGVRGWVDTKTMILYVRSENSKENETSHGASTSAIGFGDKIESIGVAHGRTRARREPLSEGGLVISGWNWGN